MILTNNPIEREGTDTEPLSVQSPKHEELEPVIGQLQSQLRVLKLERAAIVKRIGIIKKTVVGLADLFGSDVIKGDLQDLLPLQSAPRSRTHRGLTDLCRELLMEASEPLTVRQILRQLQDKSPGGVDRQRHPENSLRVILSRLVAYGEAEELRTKEGLCAWKATATVGKLAEESSPTANHKHTSQRWNSLVGSSRTFTKD
ncbi:MAG: hypothetical protein WB660_06595 [Candidatus Sulfotelmatobacter sp.]